MRAVWKIPRAWAAPSLPDRTALYPALHLRWSGWEVEIGREVPAGMWADAALRVMVTGGVLAEDERDLILAAASRGRTMVVAPQAPLPEADRALLGDLGFPIVRWIDPGPLRSAPPRRPGERVIEAVGCAARIAEDRAIERMLGARTSAAEPRGGLAVIAGSAQALQEIWPAVERRLARRAAPVTVVCQDPDDLEKIAALGEIGPGALQLAGAFA